MPNVKFAMIDCMKYGKALEEYKITEYPTVKFFTDGKEHPFTGPRTTPGVISWLKKHSETDHYLNTAEEADKFLAGKSLNVVGFFPGEASTHAKEDFLHAARHYDDVLFSETNQTEVMLHLFENHGVKEFLEKGFAPGFTFDGLKKKIEAKTHPVVVMFTEHPDPADKMAVYTEDDTGISFLLHFVNVHRFPAVVRFPSMALPGTNAEQIDYGPMFEDGRPLVVMFVPAGTTGSTAGEKSAVETEFIAAARKLRGEFLFVLSSVSHPLEKRLMDLTAVDEEESLPVVRLVTINPMGHGNYHAALKHKLEASQITASGIETFVRDFQVGKLPLFLRSEPVPDEADNDGPVRILVGDTFEKEVMDPRYDVLVEFYAPWCGHCRKLEPTYKELGRKLSGIETLKITKMDATRNEIKEMKISAYPSLFLYPAGKKSEPIAYRGPREVSDFVSFLQKTCTHSFDPSTPPKDEPVEDGLLANIEL
uniref:Thioredoxin domain-containing protein n=1 Tax=Chromera velia CCMP2878 TaxID=1169474 RepID=A0A0G4GTB7_9ALVE|eukprot:Cvel_23321.t1-p1 / transcript=Cvel_23321.t1 / gene=Cvel_23321 / organism=Chromera_velia_CCMP2878 / gene_product=Protein disulfide-isomerase A3, putative / transcript_product=Protein disulfide-isomerase A3, putative / location=Cvel_scaffold2389:845-5813(+) / protein_length=478 / sequence_SO=supercontig / SO=protein_coding / is_pseudo=false